MDKWKHYTASALFQSWNKVYFCTEYQFREPPSFSCNFVALERKILVYYDPKERCSADHINFNIIDGDIYRQRHTDCFPLKQNDMCFVQI